MARIHTIPARRLNWTTMKGPGDYDLPDEGPECPECDEPMKADAQGLECMNCGHVEDDGPDEPPDHDECDDAREWAGMEDGW